MPERCDPYPEIVVVAAGRVFLLDHNGAILWGPVPHPGGGTGGPPTLAGVDGGGRLVQRLRLDAGQQQALDLAIRLPRQPGPYAIKTTATADGAARQEATLAFDIDDRDTIASALRQELQALPLGRKGGKRRDQALVSLLEAQAHWQRHSPEAAIAALRTIQDADTGGLQARLDRLLQVAERQWSARHPAPTPSHAKAPEGTR